MGLTLGFQARTAETLSERREMAADAAGHTQTSGSEAVLLRLLGDGVVSPAQCLARSDDPDAREMGVEFSRRELMDALFRGVRA